MDNLKMWQVMAEHLSLIPLRGKVPIEKGWQKWCGEKKPFRAQDFKGHNAGICTGPASNRLVLDVDDPELFRETCRFNDWTVPETLEVMTGSGKPHYHFTYPNNGRAYGNKSFKKRGFDIRGDGGQVVSPGSIHPDTGKPYRVTQDRPVADPPQWILELYAEPTKAATPTEAPQADNSVWGNDSAWNGDIYCLPIKPQTRLLIEKGMKKPFRSEHIMTVLNGLIWSNLSDQDIFQTFESYPIGEKYHEHGEKRKAWLQPQINKARQTVTNKADAMRVLRIEEYLKEYKIEFSKKNDTFYLPHCLFDSTHSKAVIKESESTGLPFYMCKEMEDRTWGEVRKKISGDEDVSRFYEMPKTHKTKPQKEKKPTQADVLLVIAKEVELFHDPEGNAYGRIETENHKEVWNIRHRGFKQWLSHKFFDVQGKAPGSHAMTDALTTIEGIARFEGPQHEVFIRLAEKDGCIYWDLSNEHWEVIEITPSGWDIIKDPPVFFRRSRGMLPLPYPSSKGNIGKLRPFINVPNEGAWCLIVAWLIQAARPTGPYPILTLVGEQGSAKSMLARLLRLIIDPSTALLRTMPRNEQDLAVSAHNAWVIGLDNLSGLPFWLSDALCRISTGGGLSTRELYSDAEEFLFDAKRPIILNGIDDMVSRHDLADRALYINLQPIPEDARVTEVALMQGFTKALPEILAGVCDALSAALANIANTHMARLPRMADFALWVTAAEPALPWETGQFMAAYSENREDIIDLAVEGDTAGNAVRNWFNSETGPTVFEGNATQLKTELEKYDKKLKDMKKAWPKDAQGFSKRLRRAASFLRACNVNITFLDKQRPRKIRIDDDFDTEFSEPSEPSTPYVQAQAADKAVQQTTIWEEGAI